ncbi:MAG TPA: hypothetical protein VF739_17060 [Ktedonobacterales bacterium]
MIVTTRTGSSPTGTTLSYDTERRLTGFSSAATNSSASYAYDGEGQRVAQQTTSGATTTITDYLAGGLEEVTGGVLTKYYSIPGVGTALNVGGTLSYLVSDGLNSVTAALSATGSVTSTQLYAPYGGVRYSSGVLPTAKGYTGQYADAVTGLDYYNAR